jgi:hypothetical protein
MKQTNRKVILEYYLIARQHMSSSDVWGGGRVWRWSYCAMNGRMIEFKHDG